MNTCNETKTLQKLKSERMTKTSILQLKNIGAPKCLVQFDQPSYAGRSSRGCGRSDCTCTSLWTASVIVWLVSRLKQVQGNVDALSQIGNHVTSNNRSYQERQEYDEYGKIENSKTPNTSSPQLWLLQRVDRRSNLTTGKEKLIPFLGTKSVSNVPWSEPEKHDWV